MLDRFVVIGAGGSGGRTLRQLELNLRSRLSERGWHGELPEQWQFLHVDVPVHPDIEDDPDSTRVNYLGLAMGGSTYRQLDAQLASQDTATIRHFGAWRPDPTQVGSDPINGAGQYRAVGRVVAATAMPRLVRSLRETVHAVQSPDVATLVEVSTLFGDERPGESRTWTIVISSFGGGSGAGIYLDICDALRKLEGGGIDNSIAFLYTPDIFQDVTGSSAAGIKPNALAAMSELLASYWNGESPEPAGEEFALTSTTGVLVGAGETLRGPRYPFLIGRTNKAKVPFDTQYDIYRVTAAGIGAWMTDTGIQDAFATSVIGNWHSSGRPLDSSGLTDGETQPFNALGFGSLSLGRNRFATYAGNRLAGELATHLLTGHRDPNSDQSEAAILEARSEGYLTTFLTESGLHEYGPTNNQILDALRGAGFREFSEPLSTKERESLLSTVSGGLREIERDTAQASLATSLQNRRVAFLEELRVTRESNANAWIPLVQQKTLNAIGKSLALNGALGTLAILEMADRHLRDEVVPQLREEASTISKQVQNKMANSLSSIFAGAAKKLMADDSRLKRAIEDSLARWIGESEDSQTRLAADLLRDFLDGFLVPTTRALRHAMEDLMSDSQGRPGSPSPIPRWASGVPTDDLLPSAFEVFLEDPDGWSDMYQTLLQSQTGARMENQARLAAISDLLSDQTSWVRQTAAWSPGSGLLVAGSPPSTVQIQYNFRQTTIRDRAGAWIERPTSEFQKYVQEPLGHWLAPTGVTPQLELNETRLRSFLAGLTNVQNLAQPLADLDTDVARRIFHDEDVESYTRLLTPLPLDRSHPAAADIEQLLRQEFKFDRTEIAKTFNPETKPGSIDILTTLKGPVSPLVLHSLTAPLASAFDVAQRRAEGNEAEGDFWFGRRARPLMSSLPVPPHLRRAILRGWMVARALGLADLTNLERPKIWCVDRWIEISTLLGPTPTDAAEVLPSVLEGMQVALVRTPTDGRAWEPYAVLTNLGGWHRDDRTAPKENAALSRWITTGVSGCTAQPMSELQSLPGEVERRAAIVSWLDQITGQYQELASANPGSTFAPMYRAWEIAAHVVEALQQLKSCLSVAQKVKLGA